MQRSYFLRMFPIFVEHFSVTLYTLLLFKDEVGSLTQLEWSKEMLVRLK